MAGWFEFSFNSIALLRNLRLCSQNEASWFCLINHLPACVGTLEHIQYRFKRTPVALIINIPSCSMCSYFGDMHKLKISKKIVKTMSIKLQIRYSPMIRNTVVVLYKARQKLISTCFILWHLFEFFLFLILVSNEYPLIRLHWNLKYLIILFMISNFTKSYCSPFEINSRILKTLLDIPVPVHLFHFIFHSSQLLIRCPMERGLLNSPIRVPVSMSPNQITRGWRGKKKKLTSSASSTWSIFFYRVLEWREQERPPVH